MPGMHERDVEHLCLCLHCHGRFRSCGIRNTVSTTNAVEIDDDDELEKGGNVEMEHVNDPDREEQEMIDKVKMDEVQTALQSQIVPDDEEEEISQEHIEDLKKKSSESREENQDLFTPSFATDEVDYERDSQAPEIEEIIDELEAINKSTAEFTRTSDKVIEGIETEDQETEAKSGRIDDEDYENAGPKSFNPEEHLANHELPKWCRYPEPVPSDSQDEAGCQDTGKGSSGPMDRYVIRCMAQVIKLFLKKRLDVVSDFAKGVSNGFDEDDMPKGPTEKQMQALAKAKSQFS